MGSRVGLRDLLDRKFLIPARILTQDGPSRILDAVPTEPSLFLDRQ